MTNIDSSLVIASASEYAVPEGATITLFGSPSGLLSYQWTPEIGLNAPTNQQTDALINEDIIYTLSVSDGICTREDTVEIKVYEIICEDPFVFVPNAFSPNNDNNNDVLYVRGLYIEKVIFRVFDRWGEMVFESVDVSQGWDGTFRNKLLQPDVYDYYLDVTCVGGLKSIVKGNVTLMSKKYKVVIEAHADEISWFVHYITKDGFIYLMRNGGSDHMIAPSKRVNIHTEKGPVKAVFGWPAIHMRKGKEETPSMKNIFLDCGCSSKEEVEALGVHVGCVATFEDEFMILNKNKYVGRALDNRMGGFMIAEVAQLKNWKKKMKL